MAVVAAVKLDDLVALREAARQPDGFAEAALKASEYRKMEPTPFEEYIFYDHPSGATRIRVSQSESERLLFWAGRKAAFPAAGRISPDYYCMDGTIPRKRLGEMLKIMCEERGARFFLPPRKFMGDNGSMIAYTGLVMLKTGVMTPLQESKVRPNYRTDDVEVTWA